MPSFQRFFLLPITFSLKAFAAPFSPPLPEYALPGMERAACSTPGGPDEGLFLEPLTAAEEELFIEALYAAEEAYVASTSMEKEEEQKKKEPETSRWRCCSGRRGESLGKGRGAGPRGGRGKGHGGARGGKGKGPMAVWRRAGREVIEHIGMSPVNESKQGPVGVRIDWSTGGIHQETRNKSVADVWPPDFQGTPPAGARAPRLWQAMDDPVDGAFDRGTWHQLQRDDSIGAHDGSIFAVASYWGVSTDLCWGKPVSICCMSRFPACRERPGALQR